MIRHFSKQGATSFTRIQPPDMYKWNILGIWLTLNTGTGAGTRQAIVFISGFGNNFSHTLFTTGSQTGVSTAYYDSLFPIGNATTTEYGDFWIDSEMGIGMSFTLISGDNVDFDIVVDEVPDSL